MSVTVRAEYKLLMAQVRDAFKADAATYDEAHMNLAKLLGDFVDKTKEKLASCAPEDRQSIEETAASAKCQQGLQLTEAGEAAGGAQALLEGIQTLEQAPQRFFSMLQLAYNTLASWEMESDDGLPSAMDHLKKGEALYKKCRTPGPGTVTPDVVQAANVLEQMDMGDNAAADVDPSSANVSMADAESSAPDEPEVDMEAADVLAKLPAGPAKKPVDVDGRGQTTEDAVQEASEAPGETKEEGTMESDRQYAITLVQLAEVYHRQGDEDLGAVYITQALTVHLSVGLNTPSEVERWALDAAQLSGYYAHKGSFGVAHYLLRAAETVVANAVVSGMAVDAETQPNVDMAWAQLYLQRLMASRYVLVGIEPELDEATTSIPADVRIPGVSEDDLPWGRAAVAGSYEAALELFNGAMRHCRLALDVYQLPDFLPQHGEVVALISELFKNLAGCENDPHKQCVIQKQRAKRVEPLLKQVPREQYSALYSSLLYEVADAYRLITEIKHKEGRPYPKIAAAALEARNYLDSFLDTFKVDGQLPSKVSDDRQAVFMDAVFHLAWISYRLQAPPRYRENPRDVSYMDQAVAYFDYLLDYAKRHNLPDVASVGGASTQVCKEMAWLLRDRALGIRTGRIIE